MRGTHPIRVPRRVRRPAQRAAAARAQFDRWYETLIVTRRREPTAEEYREDLRLLNERYYRDRNNTPTSRVTP